jgi:pimeloyl-ACP methyl ester carboxylesterase
LPWLVKFALSVAGLYVFVALLFTVMQGVIVFPRSLVGPSPSLPQETRQLSLTRPDGSVLQGSLIPGQDATKPLILAFGGNAWNADAVALFVHSIAPEYPVAAFHFRGYAPSTGRPSANALKADALALHDHLAPDAPNGMITVGFSIGSGVAAYLSAKRSIDGAVLVTPFDSLVAVGKQTMPWLPIRLMFRHEMNTLEALKPSTVRVALILASQDEVIPPARAEALIDGLQARDRTIAAISRLQAGHNDIYSHPEFPDELRNALSVVSD